MIAWWHARRAHDCGPRAGCGGPGHHHPGHGAHFGGFGGGGGDELGGGFGVRRPLRFLAYKLDLEESQVTELARVLNDLKTERAQAAVDDRRTTSAFADAVGEDTWDEAKAAAAAETRVKTAGQLRDAVVKALGRIHAILEPAQRAKLAYLIRTGTLSI
jgi:Spy/CpxP family protein refolding chaperone